MGTTSTPPVAQPQHSPTAGVTQVRRQSGYEVSGNFHASPTSPLQCPCLSLAPPNHVHPTATSTDHRHHLLPAPPPSSGRHLHPVGSCLIHRGCHALGSGRQGCGGLGCSTLTPAFSLQSHRTFCSLCLHTPCTMLLPPLCPSTSFARSLQVILRPHLESAHPRLLPGPGQVLQELLHLDGRSDHTHHRCHLLICLHSSQSAPRSQVCMHCPTQHRAHSRYTVSMQ